jgi:hypothetical protein
VLYLAVWEGAIQRFGAGLRDAAVDAYAVALGAGIIWTAWENIAPALAGCMVVTVISAWLGIWKRL